jgi:putative addiction module killer protein
MYPVGYTAAVYTLRQTQEFQDWLDDLKDRRAQIRIVARLRLAEAGNLGDWRSVGGEVSEMRVDVGPGYRLYFTRRGSLLIIMLAGGDKSTQSRDIKRAQRILEQLELEP